MKPKSKREAYFKAKKEGQSAPLHLGIAAVFSFR
jgi:hypothetical protein